MKSLPLLTLLVTCFAFGSIANGAPTPCNYWFEQEMVIDEPTYGPSVEQCGGTCYLEGPGSALNEALSKFTGRKTNIDRSFMYGYFRFQKEIPFLNQLEKSTCKNDCMNNMLNDQDVLDVTYGGTVDSVLEFFQGSSFPVRYNESKNDFVKDRINIETLSKKIEQEMTIMKSQVSQASSRKKQNKYIARAKKRILKIYKKYFSEHKGKQFYQIDLEVIDLDGGGMYYTPTDLGKVLTKSFKGGYSHILGYLHTKQDSGGFIRSIGKNFEGITASAGAHSSHLVNFNINDLAGITYFKTKGSYGSDEGIYGFSYIPYENYNIPFFSGDYSIEAIKVKSLTEAKSNKEIFDL